MNILILGRTPSRRNTDPNIAFHGAPSYNRLNAWLMFLQDTDRHFYLENCFNALEAKFNKETIPVYAAILKSRCLIQEVDAIIALGNDAELVCKAAGVKYFKLPHPSGLNRLVNNKRLINKKLRECDGWLSCI